LRGRRARAEVPHQSKAQCGINSAPATLLVQSRGQQKSFLSLLKLEEKMVARKRKNVKKTFLLVGEC
jgi:recombinational DNA repair ATPase RecF